MRIADVLAMGGGGYGYRIGRSSDCSSGCNISEFERYEEHCYRYSNCCYGDECSTSHHGGRGLLGIL
jgi:hypothetical protein